MQAMNVNNFIDRNKDGLPTTKCEIEVVWKTNSIVKGWFFPSTICGGIFKFHEHGVTKMFITNDKNSWFNFYKIV